MQPQPQHQHQGAHGPMASSQPSGSLPPQDQNSGVPSSAAHNSGILHSQLSWGPRPGIHQQMRPAGHGYQQHQHGQNQAPIGLYPSAPSGMAGNQPMSGHSHSHLQHQHAPQYAMQNSHGAGGLHGVPQATGGGPPMSIGNAGHNIFDSNWSTMPNLHNARDFAMNFQSSTGAWQPSLAGHASAGVDLQASGCLHTAAAQNAPAGNSLSNNMPAHSSMGVSSSYALTRQHGHAIPHPNLMPHPIPSPHISSTPTLSGSFSHMPNTPMSTVPNAGVFSPVEPQNAGGPGDSAYMGAFMGGGGGGSSSVGLRRPSIQDNAMHSGGNPSMDAGNRHAMQPTGMTFASMSTPSSSSGDGITSLRAALSTPAFAPPSANNNSMMSEADMMPNYLASSSDNMGRDSHMFTSPGDAFGALRPLSSRSDSTAALAPFNSSLLSNGGGGGGGGGGNGLITTSQLAGSQLSMTDPFHAVSLELWRQLGHTSGQTYGTLGVSGREHGGAMILEDENLNGTSGGSGGGGGSRNSGMMGFHSGVDHEGFDSAMSGQPNGGMSEFGGVGAESLVLSQMQKAGTSATYNFHPGMAPPLTRNTDTNPNYGSGNGRRSGPGTAAAATSAAYQDEGQGEDEVEDDDMLASDEEGDEDDDEDGQPVDPAAKAARMRAKNSQLHRRQGVTCDQCRSKHLRCDLSDRKFKAFEATLQQSLQLSNMSESTSQSRQEAAMALQADDEAKLDAAAAAKAATSGTAVVLNNPIRCTRCEKRGMVCTKSYNPPSKRNPRPSRTGKRIEQARQLHGTRPLGESAEQPLTRRELALETIYNTLAGEGNLSESHSTDSRLHNRILASSTNIRLLTTFFAVFHIQMPVIDFDNFCYRFNVANGDPRKMAIMANGGDEEEGLPSAIPRHRNLLRSESDDPRDSTISTAGTVEALMAAMHLCAALYTDMPLVQPLNSKKLFRSTSNRLIRPMPNRAVGSNPENVNSFILPHPKGSKEDQATEQVIEAAAAEAAGKQSSKRLKRKQGVACDSCRLRRVRCDLTERPKGASCTRCEDKKINCTAEYIESIRAKGKTVVLDVVHAKAEAAQKSRAKGREVSKERNPAVPDGTAVVNADGSEVASDGGTKDAEASTGPSASTSASASASTSRDAAVVLADPSVAVAKQEEEDEDEGEEEYESDDEGGWERAQERWIRSGANTKEFGQLVLSDPSAGSSSSAKRAMKDGDRAAGDDDDEEGGGGGAKPVQQTQRSTSSDVDMGAWGRVSPQVPDTMDLVHQNDMLQWGRARQGFFRKLKDRAVELVYRHDLLHRPSAEAIQTLLILCHILYAVDPVQVKLFASVALKHIQALNLQTRHEVYEQDQEAVEHLFEDMQASRVYLTSWTRDGIMSGMYRMEPHFPEERTIQVKGGQRPPFDPSDQLKTAAIGGPQPGQAVGASGVKELSGPMGLTFSIMAMTQIGALSRFVAKHIDRTQGVPAGASATDRFPLLPTAGDMKKLARACNAVWQGTDALLQFFDKCAARSREDMDRLKPFQPLAWIASLKMCGAMLDLAVYRVLSERFGVNTAYMAAITRQMQMMSNGGATTSASAAAGAPVNPKIRPLSEEDFEQAKVLRSLYEKGRIRAMIRSRRTAHLAAFLLRKNVFQFGGVVMRQFFAVSQFLARMPVEDSSASGEGGAEGEEGGEPPAGTITTLENTPNASSRGDESRTGSGSSSEGGKSAGLSPSASTTSSHVGGSASVPPAAAGAGTGTGTGTPATGSSSAAPTPASNPMGMRGAPASPSASSPSVSSSLTRPRTESSFSGRTTASVEGEGHVPWYVGAKELGPFDTAAKKREVGWCLEAMAQCGYAWPDMDLKIASVEAIMRAEGLLP
ncbi:unnamed protein product [Tilletia controversa]|uniref:Zn(2)-C6 fungal-type domain-containing protein n=2 Tax=Tilletia TaxID=13289 RepID=A0A177VEQ4_9BASI|nr:hypothetical protein CF335_g3373 [Tilletia laevis]KAE8261225.1 hypothetical protein A4X03_0g3442 [Tilletia caries]CAD6908986.1 unnamed protein product [Tilletia controversa]CAD6893533.1 unnamed protein product [Tilletia caries]CAD6895902.1 unnamed protein product [Tilletia laevis]